jgi:TRAP transporter 4TM/12TM fusion protein
VVGILFLAYALFGNMLSGMFQTRPILWERLVIYNFLGTDAILGTPLFVAATIVTAFVLFGQMLFLTGGGDAISNFSFALMGKRKGGPAKVAIFSSALFGSLSGSASANVATTGMLTIPMMQKVGYTKPQSGAIEAVSSTGGLVLPPVMAATGFLMAEFLGIPYASIALAATIPALLFYFCVYLQVDFEAGKNNIQPYDASLLPGIQSAFKQVIPVILAFGVLLYMLFGLTQSPENSAFAATLATVFLSFLFPSMRQNWRKFFNVLSSAGESVVFIAIMCAIAGLVVGVLGLTGLGSSLSQNLVQLAGGNVWLLLFFSAFGCILLGMGVPVTATYIILIILVGPALVSMGVEELSAHMFVFYFGTLSFLTPPVCLAVFVAASIAKANPWTTSFYALRFAIVAYLIPFVFVFNPAFLMQGSALEVIMAVLSGVAAVFFLAVGLVGYFKGHVHPLMRLLLVVVGVGVFFAAAKEPLSFIGAWLVLAIWFLIRRQLQLKILSVS